MTAVILATGLALGAGWIRLALLVVVLVFPVPAAVVLAAAIWRSRARPSVRSAEFCDAVAGELRAGDSLRNAIHRAAESVQAPGVQDLCASGKALSEIAEQVGREFSDVGPELEALVGRSPDLGQPAAALFEETSTLALAQASVVREVASATAPARMTALVLLGALVAGVAFAMSRNETAEYLQSPTQLLAALVGSALVATGFGICGWMLVRGV